MSSDVPTEIDAAPTQPLPGTASQRSRGPWIAIGVLALLLGGIVVAGAVPKLRQKAERDAAAAEVQKARAVTWVKARRSASRSQLVLPGTALPIETATLYARTTGFVREFRADLGDRVKGGQILAVLDAPELESDASSAQARAAEAALNEKISRATAERYRRLAEAGASSREQADQAEAQANSAEASAKTSRAELSRSATLLDFRVVRAPFDGVITKRNVEKGTLVTAGSGAGVSSLFEVARTETLKIWVDVPQYLAADVQIGDEARVAAGTKSVPGKIVRTSGALDPTTRTLRVEIHVPGDQGILAGSFVRVGLDAQSAEPPVLIPANAVSPRGEGTFVFTVDGGKTQQVQIQLGRELGAEVEVVGGLVGGETVVTNPAENLSGGETVRLVVPAAPAPAAAASATATPAPATEAKPSTPTPGASHAPR
ncbi:MAG TPA: efflux RND transporter periplasmic adaptor subunit [Polyangiaceae bacterium]|nr:efflux RND transporter periplasmic adaptor subunit [Polyangiaceae bacterium]